METKIYLIYNKKLKAFYSNMTKWCKDPNKAYRYYSKDDALRFYGDGNKLYDEIEICEYDLILKNHYKTKKEDFYYYNFEG